MCIAFSMVSKNASFFNGEKKYECCFKEEEKKTIDHCFLPKFKNKMSSIAGTLCRLKKIWNVKKTKNLECIYVRTIEYRNSTKRNREREKESARKTAVQSNDSSKKQRRERETNSGKSQKQKM